MLVHAAHPPAGPSEDSDGVSTPTLRPHLENLPPVAAEGLLPITPEGAVFHSDATRFFQTQLARLRFQVSLGTWDVASSGLFTCQGH